VRGGCHLLRAVQARTPARDAPIRWRILPQAKRAGAPSPRGVTMNVRCVYRTGSRLFSVLLLAALVAAPPGLRAQGHLEAPASCSTPLSSIKVVHVFNLFPNVGALIYFAGPNDFGSSSSNASGVRWTPALPRISRRAPVSSSNSANRSFTATPREIQEIGQRGPKTRSGRASILPASSSGPHDTRRRR